jgi:hypothetical protein
VFGVWAQAFGLTMLGGAVCGLVSLGYVSVVLFFLTVPIGGLLGAALGLPLGLCLAVVFTALASPPVNPTTFTRLVALFGLAIALAINGPLNVWFVLPAGATGYSMVDLLGGLFALAATAMTGHECGRKLATAHLHRYSIPTPPGGYRLWRRPSAPAGPTALASRQDSQQGRPGARDH